MTHSLPLPALDGRDPLGFLAALGLLRLLTHHAGVDARLSFDDTTAHATLHSPYPTCDDVADQLAAIAATMTDGAVIPAVPASFPLAKSGTKGSDPMRVDRNHYPELHTAVTQLGDEALTWLPAIVTDLGHDDQGRVALTPYSAPSGQQTVRSFFDKPATHIRTQPEHLRAALTTWRRVPGFTGEYLDHRALHTTIDHPRGEKSADHGVPGATWLATMALPLLKLRGNGTTATATLWHRPPNQRPTMIWPLWRQPLNPAAVTVLIEHPELTPTIKDNRIEIPADKLPALGIFTVAAAQRRPPADGRKSAGVLVPAPVTLINPRSRR